MCHCPLLHRPPFVQHSRLEHLEESSAAELARREAAAAAALAKQAAAAQAEAEQRQAAVEQAAQADAAARLIQRWRRRSWVRRHLRIVTAALHDRSLQDLKEASDGFHEQLLAERAATAKVRRPLLPTPKLCGTEERVRRDRQTGTQMDTHRWTQIYIYT